MYSSDLSLFSFSLLLGAGILPKSLSSHFPAIFTAYQRRKPNDLSTIHEAEEQLLKFTGMLPSADASKTSRIDGSDVDGREHVSDDDDQGSIGRVQPPPIRFIGVFDTVGALGVPGRFGDADIVVSGCWLLELFENQEVENRRHLLLILLHYRSVWFLRSSSLSSIQV